MDSCYLGESFELSFDIRNPIDADAVPSNGTFVVYRGDAVAQSGILSIDGNRGSFRFNAEQIGMHTIEIAYTMGMDRWKMPFLLDVRETHRWRTT